MTCTICHKDKDNIEPPTINTHTHICTDCVDEQVAENEAKPPLICNGCEDREACSDTYCLWLAGERPEGYLKCYYDPDYRWAAGALRARPGSGKHYLKATVWDDNHPYLDETAPEKIDLEGDGIFIKASLSSIGYQNAEDAEGIRKQYETKEIFGLTRHYYDRWYVYIEQAASHHADGPK